MRGLGTGFVPNPLTIAYVPPLNSSLLLIFLRLELFLFEKSPCFVRTLGFGKYLSTSKLLQEGLEAWQTILSRTWFYTYLPDSRTIDIVWIELLSCLAWSVGQILTDIRTVFLNIVFPEMINNLRNNETRGVDIHANLTLKMWFPSTSEYDEQMHTVGKWPTLLTLI